MTEVREVMWRRVVDDLSFEHAVLARAADTVTIAGTVLTAEQDAPLRLDYVVACDAAWRTRRVKLDLAHAGGRTTKVLEHDGAGGWRIDGRPAAALAGCTDVDIGLTPSTNAVAINRLRLAVGETGAAKAAWVRFPTLDVVAAEQIYQRLDDRRYRYRNADSGFEAIVEVDEDGLPVDYADIWRRIADGPGSPR